MKDIDIRRRFEWLLEESHRELIRARSSMNKKGDTTTCWLYVVRTLVLFYYSHMNELKAVNEQMLHFSEDYFDMLDIAIPYIHKDKLSISEHNAICQLIDHMIVGVNNIKQRMGEIKYERIS